MITLQRQRTKVFISYSHRDKHWLERLQMHLEPLERKGLLERWDDMCIQPGTRWREEIEQALANAQVAVLLISDDFLTSDFIADHELLPLLHTAAKEGALILPVIVASSRFQDDLQLVQFQAVNDPDQPLTSLTKAEQEKLLSSVAEAIVDALTKSSAPALMPGATSGQVWYVPVPRNRFFTGRTTLFTELEAALYREKTVALTGLGGIGKTQIAAEYAYRHREDYGAILWIEAEIRETLITDLVAIAELLGLPEHAVAEQAEAVAAVQHWLSTHPDWLLILDNADDLELIRDLVPVDATGHRLLTTRDPATGELARSLSVQAMMLEEGALFLLRRAGHIGPETTLDAVSGVEKKLSQALVQTLGGLPLALDQAGAYIKEMQVSLDKYERLYQKQSQCLSEQRGQHALDYPSVATTFSLAFDQVTNANLAAAELLRVCALLYPEQIPEEIFTAGAAELGAVLASALAKPLGLVELRRALSRFSLLQRDPPHRVLTLHRVVQALLQDEMDEGTRRQWAERAVRAVNQAFPDAEFTTWPACERLVAQAQACREHIQIYDFVFEEAARLVYQTGVYLQARVRYAEAEPLYQRALYIWEKVLGVEHPAVAAGLNNLAGFYYVQGQYERAETLYQRALRIREQALGAEHPDVAQSLNNLALLYDAQGQYERAETLYQRALRIREKALGPKHPYVATSLNNLAELYRTQGWYTQAEPLYQRALHIYEQALGNEHPNVATSLNNLALLYDAQGQYEQAETLYQRALCIDERALGPEHPYVATDLHNLAAFYYAQGQYEQAEPLYQRVLHIYEQALGNEHPNVATSLHNLAELYHAQGQYEQAEPLYQRALRICEQALGPEDPAVATNLNDLAELYYAQGRYEQAEPFYERALRIREQALGPEDPAVVTSLNNLAELYRAQGRYEQAEPLYQQALHIAEKELGPEHPNVVTIRENLAILHETQGKATQTKPYYQRVLTALKKTLGRS